MRRLTPLQILASVYPRIFLAIYRFNLSSGRDWAVEKAVGFLTLLTCWPFMMLGLGIAHLLLGRVDEWWSLAAIPLFFPVWNANYRLLVRKRIGLRFIKDYDQIDPIDQALLGGVALASLALVLFGPFALLAWLTP